MPSISEILTKFGNMGSGVRLEDLINEFDSKKDYKEDISLHEIKELIDLCADQIGYWTTEYHFSSANSPNQDAESQMRGWEKLWDHWLKVLSEKVPDAVKKLIELKDHISLQCILERKLEYNQSGLFRQPISTFLSKLSIFLNQIGLKGIATSLYTASLYPKGTVGRLN